MIVNVHYIDEKTGTIRRQRALTATAAVSRTPTSEWRLSPPPPSVRPAP